MRLSNCKCIVNAYNKCNVNIFNHILLHTDVLTHTLWSTCHRQTSGYSIGSMMMVKRDSNFQCGRSASSSSQHKNAAMIKTSLYCIQYIIYPLKNNGEGLGLSSHWSIGFFGHQVETTQHPKIQAGSRVQYQSYSQFK